MLYEVITGPDPPVPPLPLKMVSLHISSIPNIFINESTDYGYGVFRMDREFLQEDRNNFV